MVVQLWPGDEGYSLSLAAKDGAETDLGVRLSYHDNHILDCLDNEEIPVIILDLLEGRAAWKYVLRKGLVTDRREAWHTVIKIFVSTRLN